MDIQNQINTINVLNLAVELEGKVANDLEYRMDLKKKNERLVKRIHQ